MNEEEWDKCVTLNLKSTFLCCKAVSRVMMRQKRGTIINMASMAALGAYPMGANYSAAKAAIKNLTETLSVELGPHNIRVNALAPGVIETQLTVELYKKRPELKIQRLKNIPLGRLGTPEDVANVALFLASDASNYISGETIAIKGAMSTFVTPELIEELSKSI
jgi:3-oxoacyl-[acyl-carrier protein] reductase